MVHATSRILRLLLLLLLVVPPSVSRSLLAANDNDDDESSKYDVLVLICTQSFTAEDLVEDILWDSLQETGRRFRVALIDEAGLFDWTTEKDALPQPGSGTNSSSGDDAKDSHLRLSQYTRSLLIVASTYGDGDPPNHALQFADWLAHDNDNDGVDDPIPYAVFALGDRVYAHFCEFGYYIDRHLAARGGQRLIEMQTSDAQNGDTTADFERWTQSVVQHALPSVLGTNIKIVNLPSGEEEEEQQQPRSRFSSTGSDWRRSIRSSTITETAYMVGTQELLDLDNKDYNPSNNNRRSVLHVTLEIHQRSSSLQIQPGDHVGIYPRNPAFVVEHAMNWLGLYRDTNTTMMVMKHQQQDESNSNKQAKDVAWAPQTISAVEFLSEHVDLEGRATSSALRALLPFVGTLELRALARELTFVNTTSNVDDTTTRSKNAFDRWVANHQQRHKNTLMTKLDLAVLFECRPSLQALARAMGPVQPRLYSIATVDHHHHHSEGSNDDSNEISTGTTKIGLCMAMVAKGLCTNYIATLPATSPVFIYFRQSNFHFHHQENDATNEDARKKSSILVSAGSGVGPYVGFLQNERRRIANESATAISPGSLSHIRILFGSRTPAEILYRDQLSMFDQEGGVTVHYAFSRVQGQPKRHVQDLLNATAGDPGMSLSALWDEVFVYGARVYACGRLEICEGVQNSLREAAMTVGGLDLDGANRRLQAMRRDGTLLTDCWSVEDPAAQQYALKEQDEDQQRHAIPRLERHHRQLNQETQTCSFSLSDDSCPGRGENNNHNDMDLSSIPAWPSYLRTLASGEFDRRLEEATNMFTACVACGRFCEVDRLSSNSEDWGECRIGQQAIVSAVDAHFGEEPCLKGVNGSGTIFFGACNLKCVYCQNWKLSAMDQGEVVSDERLAEYMLSLQERGCHNINFVSPTHNILPMLRGIYIAAKNGLRLPIVFNSGGYDSVASLRLMEGIVDIYMPDAKYAARAVARKLSKIDNYPEINQAAIKEMHHQVGDLQIDPRTGLAFRGLLVRHLILPNDYAGTVDVADFLTNEVGSNTYTHVMKYYHPEHEARDDKKYGLNRRPSSDELLEAHRRARFAGLHRILY